MTRPGRSSCPRLPPPLPPLPPMPTGASPRSWTAGSGLRTPSPCHRRGALAFPVLVSVRVREIVRGGGDTRINGGRACIVASKGDVMEVWQLAGATKWPTLLLLYAHSCPGTRDVLPRDMYNQPPTPLIFETVSRQNQTTPGPSAELNYTPRKQRGTYIQKRNPPAWAQREVPVHTRSSGLTGADSKHARADS